MAKIAFSILVKDDSEFDKLQKACASLYAHVDRLFITTTADGSKKQIQKMVRENKKTILNHFDWCDDFAKARNFAFEKMYEYGDYDMVGWIDSDDMFVGAEKLNEIVDQCKRTGKQILFFEYWYACTFEGEALYRNMRSVDVIQNRERLFVPKIFSWKGRGHESPVANEGSKDMYSMLSFKEFGVAVMHTSTHEDALGKLERNKRILELQLEEDGRDPRTLLYLMKIYIELSDQESLEKCITMGTEYLTKSGWDVERSKACEIMATAYDFLGKSGDAENFFFMALKEYPYTPTPYLRLSSFYYNMGKYKVSKQWHDIVSSMSLDENKEGIHDLQGMKYTYAELSAKLALNYIKDTEKSLTAVKALHQIKPSEHTAKQVRYLEDLNDLNVACKNLDELTDYLISIGNNDGALQLLLSAHPSITSQPFAIRKIQTLQTPKIWGDKEICYFCGPHFEKWDETSLMKGIGGSETAVIRLAAEWAKKGYSVTVYGDPITKGVRDGVTWLPYFHFNKSDRFNIFIQWRGSNMAKHIKCNAFLVDLHDLYAESQVAQDQHAVDQFMVKSQYHRDLAPSVPNMLIISNGI